MEILDPGISFVNLALMNRRPFYFSLLLMIGLFFGPFPLAISQSPEPSPTPEQPYPSGGFEVASQLFKSLQFDSKRVIRVSSLDGMQKTRMDEVEVKKDESGNYWFKKTTSTSPGDMEYYWINQEVYREDTKQFFEPMEAITVFKPIFEKNTHYWQEFWEKFATYIELKNEGQETWQGRPCNRITLEKNPTDPGPLKELKGEFLMDREFNFAIKASLEIKYSDLPTSDLSTPAPEPVKIEPSYDVTIHLKESIKNINEIKPITLPKGIKSPRDTAKEPTSKSNG